MYYLLESFSLKQKKNMFFSFFIQWGVGDENSGFSISVFIYFFAFLYMHLSLFSRILKMCFVLYLFKFMWSLQWCFIYLLIKFFISVFTYFIPVFNYLTYLSMYKNDWVNYGMELTSFHLSSFSSLFLRWEYIHTMTSLIFSCSICECPHL